VDLEMAVENDGEADDLEIRLLRPPTWIRERAAYEGNIVEIALDDLSVAGYALVTRLGTDGHIASGTRCPVTGWVRHTSRDVIPVVLDGGETLQVTRHHRLFSADRQDWVHAGDLEVGELLKTKEGSARVEGVGLRALEPTEVFNLEVIVAHHYFVGESHVLAHNAYGAYSVAFETRLAENELGLSRPRHFTIANNALAEARAASPELAELVPAPSGRASAPANWVWQHATIEQGGGRAGVVQLVPKPQHTAGSLFWRLLHPLRNGGGGYSEWAIPAGAPPN
jgi:hypothetical protein